MIRLSYPFVLLFFAIPLVVSAQSWVGNGNANSNGNWSTPANWSSNVVPSTGSTAVLGSVTADRTIVYDSGASGFLGTLNLNQSAPFNNRLELQRSLSVSQTIVLGASTGKEIIYVGSSLASGFALTSAGGITLNSGSQLLLSATGNGTSAYNFGNAGSTNTALTLQGGTLTVAPTTGTTGSTSVNSAANVLTGNLNMTAGALVIDNAGGGASKPDRRLSIQGTVNITGGEVKSTLAGPNGSILIQGLNNIFEPDSFDTDLNLALSRADGLTQDLQFNQTLGAVQFRGTGVKSLAVTLSGLETGPLQLFDGSSQSGSRTTFRLDSDITLQPGAVLPTVSLFSNQPETITNRLDVGIDTQYFTLDLTKGAGNGIWTPNTSSPSINTFWQLTGKGVIAAGAFDFSTANTTVSLEGNIMLLATRSGSSFAPQANTLARATIPAGAAPVFRYTGSGNATLVSLSALRDIQVENGTLRVLSGAPTSAPRFVVGGVLHFNQAITLNGSTRVRFYAEKTPPTANPVLRVGQIKSDIGITYGGALVLDFASAQASQPGNYNLFSASSLSPGSNFNAVALSGLFKGNFTRNDRTWTATVAQTRFTLNETTGVLTIARITNTTNPELLNDKLVVKSGFEPGVFFSWNDATTNLTLVGEDSSPGQSSWDSAQITAENLSYAFLINGYQRISNFAIVQDATNPDNRVLRTQILNSNVAPGVNSGNGRAQGTFYMQEVFNRHRWKYRQFISNDFQGMIDMPTTVHGYWTDFFELWTPADTVPGANPAGAYRIKFYFEPAPGVAGGFRWKLRGEEIANFNGWAVENNTEPVHFGQWCEWDITIIKGPAPATNPGSPARVIVLMRPEGTSDWVELFNVSNQPTQHPTLVQDGYYQVQPFKNYIGSLTVDHLLNKNATDISLYFDDFEYWVNASDGSYASWATAVLPVNQRGAKDDPDKDGVENLLEYVLGGDPNLSDASSILPVISRLPSGEIRYTFTRRELSKAGVSIVAQYSTNLVTWTDITISARSTGVVTVEENTPFAGMDTVAVTLANPGLNRCFMRLRVTAP